MPCGMFNKIGKHPEDTQWPCDTIECDACMYQDLAGQLKMVERIMAEPVNGGDENVCNVCTFVSEYCPIYGNKCAKLIENRKVKYPHLSNITCCGDVVANEDGIHCVEGNCPFMPGCEQMEEFGRWSEVYGQGDHYEEEDSCFHCHNLHLDQECGSCNHEKSSYVYQYGTIQGPALKCGSFTVCTGCTSADFECEIPF